MANIAEDRHCRVGSTIKVDSRNYAVVKEIVVPNYEYRVEYEDNHIEEIVTLEQIG